MKLPKNLNIKGVEYRIAVSDVLHDSIAGGCHPDSKVILVSSDQSKSEAVATFFHEVLHAIEVEWGVDLGHKRINKLEYALTEVFQQLLPKRKKDAR